MADKEEIKLPDPNALVVSSSPHIHEKDSIRRIMGIVICALVPVIACGVYFFGLRALWVLGVTTLSCVILEFLFTRLMGRENAVGDLSAVVTGLLLGLSLSPATPWWVCVIGAVLAIGLGKQVFGGLGYNPFNPAMVGRVGLLIALPRPLTTWLESTPGRLLPEATTTATPLGAWQDTGNAGTEYMSYFLGDMGGCIGETSALAVLIGGAVLIFFRLIRWQVPVAYIGTVAVCTGIAHMVAPGAYPTPLFHILTGGLMIGAFFKATDMVSSPVTPLGAMIFGIGCGIVTCAIRLWGTYPEGVSFAILFMNAFVPLINRYTAKSPFGYKEAKLKEAQ